METSVIQAVPLVKDEEAKGDAESGYGSPSSLNSQMSASNGTHGKHHSLVQYGF